MTLGVPRLVEIINVAKRPRMCALTVYLDEEYSQSADAASHIQRKLEYTMLKDVAQCVEIHYDPNMKHTAIEQDQDILDTYFVVEDVEEEELRETLSPWLLRIELNNTRLTEARTPRAL